MNKYAETDKAKNGIMEFVNEYGEIVGMSVTDFNILLERCATDVAEVNRCKTCFHYKPREYGYNCTVMDWDASDDDYCSRWEAKDG